jgi:hypothetical protein
MEMPFFFLVASSPFARLPFFHRAHVDSLLPLSHNSFRHSASRRVNFGAESPASPTAWQPHASPAQLAPPVTPGNGQGGPRGGNNNNNNNSSSSSGRRSAGDGNGQSVGLRRALAEERLRFAELSEEHADLLALLAQQEVVAAQVERQLKQLDPDAWSRAQRAAEHKCVQRFGLFIPTEAEGGEGGYAFGDGDDGEDEEFDEDEVYEEGQHYEERQGEDGGLQSEFEAVAEEAPGEYSEGSGGVVTAAGGAGGASGVGGQFGVADDYGEFDDELKDL